MKLNIGSSETLGEVIGDKKEISDLLEVLTIWVLNQLAHGLHLETLGQEMKETPQKLPKNPLRRN